MSVELYKGCMGMMTDVLAEYRKSAELKEEQTFHPKAAFSKNHHRHDATEDDHRLPYKRDVDRIVHSKPFARYSDKTQVVYLVDNDHITHRSLHVQFVSNFARGIAEILNLNLDLVEAISLGHDVGHPPFGHEGEGYLSELSEEYGNGIFAHPWQSCRIFSEIEPLNLGLAVYDGFLCHDGGLSGLKVSPVFGKTWESHFEEKKTKLNYPDQNIFPGTLEGCLVKISDTISYIGRDIEDAVALKLIDRTQIPKTILGNNNGDILGTLARDVIKSSYNQDFISISEEVFSALKTLREFNFEHIYNHPKLKTESKKIKQGYRILFELLYEDLVKNQFSSYVWKNFSHNKLERYLENTKPAQMVVDFVAGMTDTFFINTLSSLIVPKRIKLT
jgi:dGTPase